MLLHIIDHTALFHTTTVAAGYPETVLGPCRSTRAVGRFPADTAFSLVIINAASLRMTLHAEDDVERDAVATVPADEAGLSPQDLADEVFFLIMRGHSMHTPGCTCATPMRPARRRQLGLAACAVHQGGTCRLAGSPRQPITLDAVTRELGVAAGQVQAVRTLLHASGQFQCNGDAWALRPVLCQTEETLWAFVRKHPLGVFEDNALIQGPQLQRLVARLVQQGRLLTRRDGRVARLFACQPPLLRVDSEVQALWRRS